MLLTSPGKVRLSQVSPDQRLKAITLSGLPQAPPLAQLLVGVSVWPAGLWASCEVGSEERGFFSSVL